MQNFKRPIDTSLFRQAHEDTPSGFGYWVFTNGEHQFDHPGEYSDARRALASADIPDGIWFLQP